MVKISIILPVYNVEKYIKQCLDSLLGQTLKDLEFICVDDASTDNSLKILEKYSEQDKRIKIIKLDSNQGQGSARNIGLEYATGEYIGFVDPDDFCELTMFEEMYNQAKKYDVELVEIAFFEKREGKSKKEIHFCKNKEILNKTFNWKMVSKDYAFSPCKVPWNRLYKTSLIRNNNIKFGKGRFAEDQIFAIKSRLLAKNIRFYNKPLYNYLRRLSSSANGVNKDIFNITYLLNDIKLFLLEENFYDAVKTEFNDYITSYLSDYSQKISSEDFIKYDKLVKDFLPDDLYEVYLKKINSENLPLFKKIFSILNVKKGGITYKVLTILGIKFKWRKKSPILSNRAHR